MSEMMIAQLQQATKGSPDLDGALLAHFGFTWRGMNYWHYDNQKMWSKSSKVTQSVDAAISLALFAIPLKLISIETQYRFHAGKLSGKAEICGTTFHESVYATTPSLALNIATLKACILCQSHKMHHHPEWGLLTATETPLYSETGIA